MSAGTHNLLPTEYAVVSPMTQDLPGTDCVVVGLLSRIKRDPSKMASIQEPQAKWEIVFISSHSSGRMIWECIPQVSQYISPVSTKIYKTTKILKDRHASD